MQAYSTALMPSDRTLMALTLDPGRSNTTMHAHGLDAPSWHKGHLVVCPVLRCLKTLLEVRHAPSGVLLSLHPPRAFVVPSCLALWAL